MRFKFDADQDFQIQAVEAVTDLLEGQRQATILANLHKAQARTEIARSEQLKLVEGA